MARDQRLLAFDADPCPPDPAVLENLGQNMEGGIACNRKADALSAEDDRGIDTDHPALPVDQRPARIAGVECGIGLDDVIDEPAVTGSGRPADCTDATGRHRLLETQGIAE